jgi:thioredoxin reductase
MEGKANTCEVIILGGGPAGLTAGLIHREQDLTPFSSKTLFSADR